MNTATHLTMKLRQLATIRSGYALRQGIKSVENGNVHVIQIKDINKHNLIDSASVTRTQIDNIKPEQILQNGDILLRARGENRQAALFAMAQATCLAAPQFLIISVTAEQVLPEYIYWYINQKPAQSFLSKNAVGTNILNIPAQALGKLPIVLPSLQRQRSLIALNRLVAEEQQLLQQKINNSRRMMTAIVQQLIKEP